MRLSYARASAIFCISDYTKQQLCRAGLSSRALHTVPLGRSPLPVATPAGLRAVSARFGISHVHFPIVLTVGAIKPRKGQLDTLHAVALLRERYPNILYIAVGSGHNTEYHEQLTKCAKDNDLNHNLKIIADIDDDELSALYEISTLLALNSTTDEQTHHFEGFGLAVIEAAGYGKPAVGSLDSGIQDSIRHGETGYLTMQRDPADIACKIVLLLSQYRELSRNALEWSRRFTWKETVSTYIKYYSM